MDEVQARIDVRTLGHFTIRCGQRTVELNGRKSRALIGYLVLIDGHRETRDRLVGLLWSESDEARARASLRQAVYEVREAFQGSGCEGISADRLTVALDRAVISVDLLDVMEEAKAGRAHPLLLEGERPIDTLFAELEAIDPAFNVWLLARRQSYADRITAHLQDALRRGAPEVERVARALLNLDPTNEEAARALIRARVAVGDTGGALGIYKALWDLLERDYDTEPSKETQDLIAEVKLGQGGPAPVLVSAPSQPQAAFVTKLVVSIGGFDTTGTSEKHRYLIHGFRQELIANLVRFREWVVRDQAGVEAGASRPGAGAGEYVIDASAFEGARGLRLLLMLRDARNNDYLWSERIELSIEHWFDAQQAIVQRLAAALNVYISAGRFASATDSRDADASIYDLWLRAQGLVHSFNFKAWHEARNLMLQVTQKAPGFAPAFSSLSQLNNTAHIALPGVFRDQTMSDESLQFARQAVRLDPIDSRSQLCLGWAFTLSGAFEQGSLHHELALELNDSDSWILLSTALGAAFRGEHAQAEQRSERAVGLFREPSPVYWGYCAQVAFLRGDYSHAVDFAARADGMVHFLAWKAAAAGQLNETATASAALQTFFECARQRWQGEVEPTPANISQWFLHCFPIRDEAAWCQLRDGLAAAGAPVKEAPFDRCCMMGRLTHTS